jgi:thiol-disulfide isomerase/thioredoxin
MSRCFAGRVVYMLAVCEARTHDALVRWVLNKLSSPAPIIPLSSLTPSGSIIVDQQRVRLPYVIGYCTTSDCDSLHLELRKLTIALEGLASVAMIKCEPAFRILDGDHDDDDDDEEEELSYDDKVRRGRILGLAAACARPLQANLIKSSEASSSIAQQAAIRPGMYVCLFVWFCFFKETRAFRLRAALFSICRRPPFFFVPKERPLLLILIPKSLSLLVAQIGITPRGAPRIVFYHDKRTSSTGPLERVRVRVGAKEGAADDDASLEAPKAHVIAAHVLDLLPDVHVFPSLDDFRTTVIHPPKGTDGSITWLVLLTPDGGCHGDDACRQVLLELRRLASVPLSSSTSMASLRVRVARLESSQQDIVHLRGPTVVLFKPHVSPLNGDHYMAYEKFYGRGSSASEIASFVKGSITSGVISMTAEIFDREVGSITDSTRNVDHTWVIDFYAPWCTHCIELQPEFAIASRTSYQKWQQSGGSGTRISFASVDCVAEEMLCRREGIGSYPTTMLYHKSNRYPYQGQLHHQMILNFIDDNLYSSVTYFSSIQQFDEVITLYCKAYLAQDNEMMRLSLCAYVCQLVS